MWIHEFIKTQIPNRDFDMIQNIRRAARSTTRNIAEGFGRYGYKDNAQFCKISRGSLQEIKEDLNISVDEEICTEADIKEGKDKIAKALYSLNGYIKYLNDRANDK